MDNLSTVPSTGTFGQAVNVINQNFGKTELAINQVEENISNLQDKAYKDVGYFASASALEAAYPQPTVGMYAGVWNGSNAYIIYQCNTAGTWTSTGNEDPRGLVIDSSLDATSDNPVKNKTVTNEIYLGGVYDVTAHNSGATFASLSALLSDANLNTIIPLAVRKGGMSIKFVQTSDNKYVQYRLMSDSFNTTPANWQGIDDEPTAGSDNLVDSRGIAKDISFETAFNLVNKGLGTSGVLLDNNAYVATDYIEVNKDNVILYCGQISVGGSFANICAYNAQKGFVSVLLEEKGVHQKTRLTIPNGVSYIRACSLNTVEYYIGIQVKSALDNLDKKLVDNVHVLDEKIKDLDIFSNSIIIDYGWVEGKYINKNNGNEVSYENMSCTTYIPVIAGVTYATNAAISDSVGWAIYNRDKAFIQGGNTSPITIPDNGYYLRLSTRESNVVHSDVYIHIQINNTGVFSPFISKGDFETALNGVPRNVLYPRINLQKSAFVEDTMIDSIYIPLPVIDNSLTKVDVGSIVELKTQIANYNEGSDLFVNITNDIVVNENVELEGSADIVICGNGHKLILGDRILSVDGNESGYNYASLGETPLNIMNSVRAITDKGNVLNISESEYFTASERVLKTDGSNYTAVSDKGDGIAKIKLPNSMSSISVVETDNVYIKLSTGWMSIDGLVKEFDDGYCYFYYDKNADLCPDYDYILFGIYPVFKFINLDFNPNSFAIKDGKVYFPMQYSSLAFNSSVAFEINNTSGNVFIDKVEFTNGGISVGTVNDVSDSNVIVTDCAFKHMEKGIYTEGNAKVYIKDSYFEDISILGIYNAYYVVNNTLKNIGDAQQRSWAVKCDNESYIAYNHIENYYYVGVSCNDKAIVERNILHYSLKHFFNMRQYGRIDGGAIYFGAPNVSNTWLLIRFNKIVNYVGRGRNIGIYGDHGANNVTIIGNVIQNCPTYYAIDLRYVANSLADGNCNKIVAHNILDNSYRLQGNPNIASNGCKAGYNVLNIKELYSNAYINSMQQSETQIYTLVTFDNGYPLFNCVNTNLWGI